MDQEKLTNLIQDKVLELLPEEGIKELAAIYDNGGTDNDVRAILEKYNVDINAVAKDLAMNGGKNE